jgi:hypothetical protein
MLIDARAEASASAATHIHRQAARPSPGACAHALVRVCVHQRQAEHFAQAWNPSHLFAKSD